MPPGSRKNKRLARFRETFFAECDELMVTFEERLKQMASPNPDPEIIQEAYRAVHSIKGGSGVFGLTSVSELSQKMEAVLAQIRSEALGLDQPVLELMNSAFQLLTGLISRSKADENIDEAEWQGMVETLDALLSGQGVSGPAQRMGPTETSARPPEPATTIAPAPKPEPEPEPEDDDDDDDDDFELFDDAPTTGSVTEEWEIDFRPGPDLLRRGNEPLALIRELGSLGTLRTRAVTTDLPALAALDPEVCHLRWILTLDTSKSKADIEEVFEFVEDDCQLTISRKADTETATAAKPAATPVAEPVAEPAAPHEPTPEPRPVAATTQAPAQTTALATVAEAPKIEADQFAELVNMANELIIQHQKMESQLERMAISEDNDENAFLLVGMTNLGVGLGQLQDRIAALSMAPAAAVFEGIVEYLMDIGPGADGEVRTRIRADSVRADRRAVTAMCGPLRDLARLLVHGRLTGSTASAATDGPATLHGWAGQSQGRLVARLRFDGRYHEPSALYRQAVLAGHVADDAGDGWQAAHWVLEPGAWDAPRLDGRGGLDLASLAERVRAQGGRLDARIAKAEGLELTLSMDCDRTIIDGLFVRHGDNYLGLPVNRVLATVRPDTDTLQSDSTTQRMIDFRGAYLPLVFADRLLGLGDPAGNPDQWLVAIVETREGRNLGLVTHGVIGRRALPVMDLGRNMHPVPALTGAVCLEDDRLALLLDPAFLSAEAEAPKPVPVEDGAAPTKPMRVDDGGRVLSFTLAGERYGIPMTGVRQVLSRRPIQRLPGAGAGLLGAVPWNGMVLPVIDPTRTPARIDGDGIVRESLIVLADGGRHLAIPCDDRPRLFTLTETALQPVPETSMSVRRGLLGGMGSMDGRPVAILDGPELFRETAS